DKGEVVLKEMWPVLLDAVPAVDTSSGCYRNVALVLVAKQPEDPALCERWIGYDLWLVVDSPATHWTRRLQLIGKQGQSVGFDYGMFRSRITVVTLPRSPYPYSDTLQT